MNFIKEIFQNKPSNSAHKQFIRFGKGEYGKKALLSLWKTKNIKIKGSFEFANDFVLLVADLNSAIFNGSIWSKEEIEGLLGVKKEGKWIYDVDNLTSSQVRKLADKAHYFLLNADGDGIKLRIKSKPPKPGKSEEKVDDKFCQMEIDEKYYNAAKEDFFWDLPDCKKASVEHKFIINEIIFPKTDEKDYAKIRELAKRKGRIVRIANIDGREVREETEFEA